MRIIGPLIHSIQLFKWLATADREQGVVSVETLTLTPSTDVKETVDWFRWRGYRAVVTSGTFAPAGVVFSRKNEPAMIAVVGDELVWDGRNIVVKES